MRTNLSFAAALAALAFLPATALAQDPDPAPDPDPDPPPTDCMGLPTVTCNPAEGDKLSVVAEPAGDNCSAGGIKITVTHPAAPPVEGQPPPQPTTEVFYVCNGQQGQDGNDGADGGDTNVPEPPDSLPVDDGGSVDPIDDSDSDFDTPRGTGSSTTTTVRRSCVSRRVTRLRLPVRFRPGQRVRVRINGRIHHAQVPRTRKIRLSLRGLRCGFYPVMVTRARTRTVVYVYQVKSATRFKLFPLGYFLP